jgi:hypothetical protein
MQLTTQRLTASRAAWISRTTHVGTSTSNQMTRLLIVVVIGLAMTASACTAQEKNAEYWAKLKMASIILAYDDQCENRSAPGYYVDKAKDIRNQASSKDRELVLSELRDIQNKEGWLNGDGNRWCKEVAVWVRYIVALDFQVPSNPTPVEPSSPKFPTGLTAKITRVEPSGQYFYPLIVVDNQTSQTYSSTQWSCTFFDQSGEPIHEDTFTVQNVTANGRTAHKSISRGSARFVSSSCRPTSVS